MKLDIEQRALLWKATRVCMITGTRATRLMTAKKREGLIDELLSEFFTSQHSYTELKVRQLERGRELEGQALDLYELEHRGIVERSPFLVADWNSMLGSSPDALVDEDGMVEIKCPEPKEQARTFRTQIIPPEYIHQMQWNMWICERDWCDYFSYCPEVIAPMDVIKITVDRDDEMIEDMSDYAQMVADIVLNIFEKEGVKI